MRGPSAPSAARDDAPDLAAIVRLLHTAAREMVELSRRNAQMLRVVEELMEHVDEFKKRARVSEEGDRRVAVAVSHAGEPVERRAVMAACERGEESADSGAGSASADRSNGEASNRWHPPFLTRGSEGNRLPTANARARGQVGGAPAKTRPAEKWTEVARCNTKLESMAEAKRRMRTKFRAGPNSSIGAYYRCVAHDDCTCEYRTRYSKYHDTWFVSKRNFQAHEAMIRAPY